MFTASAEFYDAIYSFKDYGAESTRVADLVRALSPSARTVLDVGCGTGAHVQQLATIHQFEADGLDLDPKLLRIARAKHPAGHFFEADMSAFSLGRRYDVVLCLFSSLGYLVTLERVGMALRCFARHLAFGGIVLVEPWFSPDVLEPDRVGSHSSTVHGVTVQRTSRIEVAGRVSRLHFTYTISGPSGTQQLQEVHELGLFTPEELGAAFATAGLAASFDEVGLSGRGLWTARHAA
jgi:ubiquinone/menaquinone biosynthesis C-methylase UbiE